MIDKEKLQTKALKMLSVELLEEIIYWKDANSFWLQSLATQTRQQAIKDNLETIQVLSQELKTKLGLN